MAYRNLAGIDEKILRAIWQLGAAEGAKKVTARKVGALCGISDYTVFCHFGHSNRGFLDAAAKHFYSGCLEPLFGRIVDGGTAEALWDDALETLLSEADGALYFKSYNASFGLAEELFPSASRKQAAQALAAVCGKSEAGQATLLFDHFLSCAFSYAEYLSRGLAPDTPETRSALRSLVCRGLSG